MATKTEAFARYGVVLTNVRWSWSGIAPNGEAVLGLWQNEFNYKSRPISYQPNPATNQTWRDRLGNRERIAHLKHAQRNSGGRFRVVIMKAVDILADPREVEEAFARENMIMQLVELDETTGVFLAHLVENVGSK